MRGAAIGACVGEKAMRILIVDDEPAVHDGYRRCFATRSAAAPGFTFHHARQGLDAVGEVERAVAAAAPYAVAFIDLHMLPGIDGRETARRIRALDPDINLVMVTGCPDFSPVDIAGPADKVFYVAKPFEAAEIVQTATALTARWRTDRKLAARLAQLEERNLELAANESRAIHIATHDSLTDAPNRLAFVRALADRTRRPGAFATAMLDLDRFKLVNDTLGHLAGDRLIQEVYGILDRSAPDGALVARLGGDEFGVLFDTQDEAAAVIACERIIAACSAGVQIFGHSVQSGASAGLVVTMGDTGRDPTDVLRRADLALNEAKRAGRGVARLFDESMDEGVCFRRGVEEGLGRAIAQGELSLAYQPIVSRDQLEVLGFEALLRWSSADYGAMSPAVFIPIAEESNLIHELGDWVLDQALAQLRHWPGQYVSVNFSPRQFRRHDFVGHLMQAVRRAEASPARVQIEITETAIFDDAERAAETLGRLREMGFRIALDDFGTGYSSLYNIRTFALDCLKIDRSFIDGMGRERESAAIVHSIIHLGRALGLGVIAEGVETGAQVQALRIAGAAFLQGFHLARPMPAEAARALAERRFVDAGEDANATGTQG